MLFSCHKSFRNLLQKFSQKLAESLFICGSAVDEPAVSYDVYGREGGEIVCGHILGVCSEAVADVDPWEVLLLYDLGPA